MAGTDKVQEEIIEEFSAFDEWLDRYEVLIGLGNELPAIAPAHRDEQHLIEGCQSRVWVDARLEEGKVYYSADSDAIITKGIIALLIRVLNGRTPQQVLDTDLYFIDRIGLRENLSPTRANGLAAMIIATLKNIYDPEIPVNVYDLGLVYNIDYMPDGTAEIQMTLTAPNCPMADMLVEDVRTQVAKIPGVERVNVALVFDPPWDKDMMSDEAKLELGFM